MNLYPVEFQPDAVRQGSFVLLKKSIIGMYPFKPEFQDYAGRVTYRPDIAMDTLGKWHEMPKGVLAPQEYTVIMAEGGHKFYLPVAAVLAVDWFRS